jgi:hypothetical protein
MTESKSVALPLGYSPLKIRLDMGRLMGIEPTNVGTTIRCVNHFATTAMFLDRGSRNRTHTEGFGDLCSTFKLYPFKKKRWLRTESNRRHKDFQSFALPTELLSHNYNNSLDNILLRPSSRFPIGTLDVFPLELTHRALPTEILSHKLLFNYVIMAVPTGIEPAISCVTGRHVNRYTTGPKFFSS